MNWISYSWMDMWAEDSVYVFVLRFMCASKSFDKSIYHATDQQQDDAAGRFSSGFTIFIFTVMLPFFSLLYSRHLHCRKVFI